MLIDPPNKIGVPDGSTLADVFPEMTVDLSLRIRKATHAAREAPATGHPRRR
jgi:hypothetical protein